MIESIEAIGIVGVGRMGVGIAYGALLGGFRVLLRDVSDDQIRTGIADIVGRAEADYRAGKLSRLEYDIVVSHLDATDSNDEWSRCRLIIEAVIEDEATKRSVYADLLSNIGESTVIATNTSSISVTRLASGTDRPDRFIGMHFAYPVHSMKLVELVRGIETSDSTFEIAKAFIERLDKTPVHVEDFPGFVVDRVLLSMINEAVYVLHEGVASVGDIDLAMRFGAHHPMGPLELADLLGLDRCLSLLQALHRGLSDTKYRPCPLLVKYVEAGWTGQKVQRGFYDYRSSIPVPSR